MILVDTSIWVDHLRAGDKLLARLLDDQQVLAHPWVTGELALGSLQNRDLVLRSLRDLPVAVVADHAEVMTLVERQKLWGRGIGYVDAQLLASARLTVGALLWTRDRALAAAAGDLLFAAQ